MPTSTHTENNIVAGIITDIRQYEHINPVLGTLHWLPTNTGVDWVQSGVLKIHRDRPALC